MQPSIMDMAYDEDLSENEFLQEFRHRYETTLQRVIKEGWIVCVPRAKSFAKSLANFQENEINAHVLIPRQDHSAAQFNTLSGKEVLLVDKVLTVKHDNTEQHSSRLLFEETFYNKDLCKYCVWCIEQPLEDSMCILDNCVSVITNLQEAVSFLQVELLEKELYADIESKIKDFLYINKDLDCKSIETQRDLVHDLYADCLKILLENAATKETSISKHYYWNVRVSLETYILYSLRHVLLKSLSACTAVEDANLNKIMRNLDEIQLNALQIRSDLQSRIHEAKLELSRLDCFVTVLGKIECLKRTVNYLSHGMSSIVSSDDLLPVLIFLVIKTSLSNWTAQLTFMKQFRFSASSVRETDVSDFLVTSLEATIEHIRSGAISKDRANSTSKRAKEFVDARTRSTLDESNSSIDHLFTCIEEGNLLEVEKILLCDKSSQTNDIALCHPLCICALCEQKWSRHRDLNVYPRDDRSLTPLHVAILHDQVAIVDFLLDHETDVNVADSDGLTALHYACIEGHQGTLLRVLHANANPMATDSVGNTPLHSAVDRGHENCAKALLYLSEQMKIPINVNAANDNGDTALHLAAKWGYSTIVHVLLECGANCKLTNRKGQSPLAITYNKYIAELLEYYALAEISVCSLRRSTSFQQYEQTTLEKNHGALLHPPKYKIRQQRAIDRLLAAIADGDTCLACYYLGLEVYRERSSDVRSGSGLCHPLCDCERCSTIGESLLERSKGRRNTLTVNACNGHGETALHVASATGRTEIVRLLLDAGANVNATTTSENRAPLHLACLNGNVDVAKLLLNCATCNVDARDRDGDTPLHLVARAGDAKLVNLLLRHGANTDVRNQHNMTPLRQLELETSNVLSSNYADIIRILRRNSAPQLTNNA